MNNSHYHAGRGEGRARARERERGRESEENREGVRERERERERERGGEIDFATSRRNRRVIFKARRASALLERAILIQFDISLLK